MLTERAAAIRKKGLCCLAGALVILLVTAGVAFAQGLRRGGRYRPHGPRHGLGPRMHRGRHHHRHPPRFFSRLRDLPPEEQERVLANDERFQRLPPERQAMIRERLRQWNALSPEAKERIRERQDVFASLSPTQRREARVLFQQWRRLETDRRLELTRAFRQLRDLPPAERQRFLSGAEIEKRFSPEEHDLLEGLSRLLPESRGQPPDEHESKD